MLVICCQDYISRIHENDLFRFCQIENIFRLSPESMIMIHSDWHTVYSLHVMYIFRLSPESMIMIHSDWHTVYSLYVMYIFRLSPKSMIMIHSDWHTVYSLYVMYIFFKRPRISSNSIMYSVQLIKYTARITNKQSPQRNKGYPSVSV